MGMYRFLFFLAVILTCLGTVCLGTRVSQAQDVTQETDIAKLERLAEQGNAIAQAYLGTLYFSGRGVPQDYAKAAAWEEKAAEQGNAIAQTFLGSLYAEGKGVTKDYAKAAAWHEKAAMQGYAESQFILGWMYDKGQGVPQDYTKAAAWFEKAAVQDHAKAQFILGGMYYLGQGVPQDYAKAAVWHKKGAVRGEASAQHLLGLMYAQGEGVPQDYVQAHKWLNLAAAQGNKSAAELRDNLARRMTSDQIAKAQRLAREWKPVSPELSTLIFDDEALANNMPIRTGMFDDLIPSSETTQNRVARDGFVPLPLEQGKKTGSWEDDFVPIEPAPATEPPPTPEKKSLAPQMALLIYVLASVLITWGIGLTPPLLIRFAFLKRPINKKYAFIVCALFLLVNATIFIALGSESKTHAALYLIAYVSYLILTTKLKSGSDSLQTIFYAKKRG